MSVDWIYTTNLARLSTLAVVFASVADGELLVKVAQLLTIHAVVIYINIFIPNGSAESDSRIVCVANC